jgi:6-phosphofructokinase 2
LQYRFGLPGPTVRESEWKAGLALLQERLQEHDFVIASGKLPPGIPHDFYRQVGEMVHAKKAKFILDTKGEALVHALEVPIFLLKPNISELCTLGGVDAVSYSELEPLAQKILNDHPCEMMVVSLGSRGALLVTRSFVKLISAPVVEEKNRIGAGDSMVAGMVLAQMNGKPLTEMAEYGVACGAAATMRAGTKLCQREDVDRIYAWIRSRNQKVAKLT